MKANQELNSFLMITVEGSVDNSSTVFKEMRLFESGKILTKVSALIMAIVVLFI